MKIVCFEDYFHPDTGYQIGILCRYLASFGHEVSIVTSELEKMPTFLNDFFSPQNIEQKDAEYTRRSGVKVTRVPIFSYKSGRSIHKPGLRKLIDSMNPDILYVHGESGIPALYFIRKYKSLKYALILDSHMLEYAAKNKFNKWFYFFYRHFIATRIKRHELVVIKTQNSQFLQNCLGVPSENTPWISFGSDTMLFHPDTDAKMKFRLKHAIAADDFVVAYAGKLDESKGGTFFSEAIVEKIATQTGRNVVFVVVGNVKRDEQGERVEANFSKSANRVLRFPTQMYASLPEFFQAADIGVIPAAGSLIFYDMQACGLPVLWSDETLNVERVSHSNGFHFKKTDIANFREKIEMCANMDADELAAVGANALGYIKKSFDYEDIARRYEEIIISEYKRQKALKDAKKR